MIPKWDWVVQEKVNFKKECLKLEQGLRPILMMNMKTLENSNDESVLDKGNIKVEKMILILNKCIKTFGKKRVRVKAEILIKINGKQDKIKRIMKEKCLMNLTISLILAVIKDMIL